VLKVVFDTNVYLSALNFRGKSEKAYRAFLRRKFTLITSPQILKEVAEKLREIFDWDDEQVIRALKQIARRAEVINPDVRLHIIQDEPDNRVLECALEGRANVIVSGDRDLKDLKSYQDIGIMGSTDFLRTLGNEVGTESRLYIK